jgi:hypothetical protein
MPFRIGRQIRGAGNIVLVIGRTLLVTMQPSSVAGSK